MQELQKNKPLKIAKEVYDSFIQDLELCTIVIRDIDVKSKLENMPSPGNQIPVKISNKSEFFRPDNEQLIVHHLSQVVSKNKQTNKEICRIRVLYVITYSSRFFSEEIWPIFSTVNVPVNIWPYFREFVHNTTQRCGLPTLTLGMLKRM